MINIVDNVISKEQQDMLERVFLSSDFPWFFYNATGSIDRKSSYSDNIFDSFQFVHNFVVNEAINSGYFGMLSEVCNNLAIKENIHTFNMHRVKANLTFPQLGFKKGMYKPVHVDIDRPNYITAIYYVNDSDGDTLFFKDVDSMQQENDFTVLKRISPKKGSLVYFPSNILHSSEFPLESEKRCVINFNFFQGLI
jgi:hypothetical protein